MFLTKIKEWKMFQLRMSKQLKILADNAKKCNNKKAYFSNFSVKTAHTVKETTYREILNTVSLVQNSVFEKESCS